MNILLLTDGSAHSLEAAHWLTRHAAELREPPRIELLYVHPPLPYPRAEKVVGRAAVEDYHREGSQAALEPAPGAEPARRRQLAPDRAHTVSTEPESTLQLT